MTFKNLKIQKFISALIIIAIIMPVVLFSRPEKSEAGFIPDFLVAALHAIGNFSLGTTGVQTTTQTGLKFKDLAKEILQNILQSIAKRLLSQMTKSTLNWINSGFHGAPLFVENPKSFFTDIVKYEVKGFVDQIGYDSLGFPFGRAMALNTIYTYRRTFSDNAQYSLGRVTNDPAYLNNYRNNFSAGGWEGFLLNTQYPQNNSIGFRMLATEEISKRINVNDIQTGIGQVQDTLQKGLGYLSPQTCPSNPSYNNLQNQWNKPSFNYAEYNRTNPAPEFVGNTIDLGAWVAERDRAVAEWSKTNTCPGGLQNTTPGSSVGAMVNKALGGTADQTTLAAAMGNSVSAIVDALLNRFLQEGLNKLSSAVNPPPPVDDWTYEGQGLGTAGPANSTAWDAGPDEVIILSEFKKGIDDGINNTKEEILLIDQIGAVLNKIWPKIRELDQCVPGPDIKWEERLTDEEQRNNSKFQEEESDEQGERAALAKIASSSLKFAV